MNDTTWLDKIPGSMGPPYLGRTLGFWRNSLGLVVDLAERYGPVFKTRVFGETVIGLMGAEANRFVLIDEASAFSNEGGWDLNIGELFEGGLMLKDGDDHHHHRSIMQAAFHTIALNAYLEPMAETIRAHLDEWIDRPPERIYPTLKDLTLELAARVFVGLDLEDEIDRVNRAFLDCVNGSIALLRRPVAGVRYRRGLRGREVLANFFARIVEQRRDDPGPDMLGRLMQARGEHGERLTDREIGDHMIFLLMAAHDTTTSGLTSLFYELGRATDRQEALGEVSRTAPFGDEPDLDGLRSLEGLDRAGKEALRLHPPLLIIPRRTVREVSFGGYRIPPGVMVAISPGFTHRQEENWSEPDRFDPDRFAPPRSEHRRSSCCYLPFGGGAHLCIGQAFAEFQGRLIMHLVLRRFRWSTSPGYLADYQQVPFQAPRDGLPLKFEVL